MVSALTGCRLHDHNCGFKLYRREVLDEVGIYGELHRFVPVLAHATGLPRRRDRGPPPATAVRASKYGVARFSRVSSTCSTVRFLTRFSQRPLHVLGGIGLVLLTIGGLVMLYLAIVWLDPNHRADRHAAAAVLRRRFVIVGIQLLSLGILAELVTAYNIRPEDTYSVVEQLPAREDTDRRRRRDARAREELP